MGIIQFSGRRRGNPAMVDRERGLRGKRVAITGRLASMTREEAIRRITAAGGRYAATPDRTTALLVVGQFAPLLAEDGHPTRSLALARRLHAAGAPIRIVPEEELLFRLGLQERQSHVHRLFTTAQLGRILEVPVGLLRDWVRAGLIQPVRVVRRLCFFDFQQVATVRALRDLIAAGVSRTRIQRSLDQLARWLPGADRALVLLEALEVHGPLLLRLDDGRLAEPSGQLRFDFGDDPGEQDTVVSATLTPDRSVEAWFELGIQAEADGRLEEAVVAYLETLAAGGVQPEVSFNLGNTLFALGRKSEAVDRYLDATDLEPDFVEAWNNLANALIELGRFDEAIRAYYQALAVEPDYADVQYNLAEAFAGRGFLDEARHHWRAYLEIDPSSAWADRVRDRLAQFRD